MLKSPESSPPNTEHKPDDITPETETGRVRSVSRIGGATVTVALVETVGDVPVCFSVSSATIEEMKPPLAPGDTVRYSISTVPVPGSQRFNYVNRE